MGNVIQMRRKTERPLPHYVPVVYRASNGEDFKFNIKPKVAPVAPKRQSWLWAFFKGVLQGMCFGWLFGMMFGGTGGIFIIPITVQKKEEE